MTGTLKKTLEIIDSRIGYVHDKLYNYICDKFDRPVVLFYCVHAKHIVYTILCFDKRLHPVS